MTSVTAYAGISGLIDVAVDAGRDATQQCGAKR